ncbi:papilin [Mantella aurantiaca]
MKALLLFVTLTLLFDSAFSGSKKKRQSDFWDNWSDWGECSRSCGGGVSFRERQCYSRRADGGSNCIGPTRNYRSCNVQECPDGSRDFRAEQCSEYDGMEFQGKRYKWLPYYGASNKCELNCIPKGENFYYRHKNAVLDGTPCEPGRSDICVEGVCKTVGCDKVLDSSKREDRCLVCGGDGSTCYEVKGSYDTPTLSKGYSQLFTIPIGAVNIQVKEITPTRNFLAVKNARGEYYLNGHWTIEYSQALHIASTILHYYRGSEGDLAPEVLTARGPTTEPLVIELIGQESNRGIQYQYYLRNQEETDDYLWSYGSWSECSAECGGGYQSRLVFCTIDNEAYPDYMCRDKPAPPSNRTCSTQPCPQTKRMSYIYQPTMWSRIVNTKMNSWKIGEWGPCTATCGGGTQTRSVYCISYEGRASQQAVNDAECAAFTEKPATQQVCNLRACAKWNTGPWTPCSAECGEGIQKRTVTCRTDTGAIVQDTACMHQAKPTDSQLCYGENCVQEIGWHIGEWGLCSKSCNNGIRKRQVVCADNDRNFYEPETCEAYEPEKPSVIESCNMQPCYLPQQVPSMQDTWGYDNSDQFVLTRYQEKPTPPPEKDNNFLPPANDCRRTRYSCCPDRVTPAKGYNNEGCPSDRNPRADPQIPSEECRTSQYGCCFDNINKAAGPLGEGCRSISSHCKCTLTAHEVLCVFIKKERYTEYIVRGTNNWHIYQSDSSLVISSVQVEDAGIYTCTVSNGNRRETHKVRLQVRGTETHEGHRTHDTARGNNEGVRKSSSSTSQVSRDNLHSGRRTSVASPIEMEANLGHRARLSCHLHMSPSTTVDWQKDGLPLPSPRYRKQADGSLVISRVSSEDAGSYTCATTNGHRREFKQIQLKIKGELKITDPPSGVTVSEGEEASLKCVVRGDNVNVQWSRNGVPVQPDGRHTYVSHDGSLIIRNTKTADEGSYTCNAYSGSHSISASAEVKVNRHKPVVSSVQTADSNSECVDNPELANCDLIVYAQLCNNEYYSSFCCASCSKHGSGHSQRKHHG